MKNGAILTFIILAGFGICLAQPGSMEPVLVWDRFEGAFVSQRGYENPLYDISEFYALLRADSKCHLSGQVLLAESPFENDAVMVITEDR